MPANGTVVAYLDNGNGTFTVKSTMPTPSAGFLVLADFNHDGKLDFATSGNLIALGNGDGTFQRRLGLRVVHGVIVQSTLGAPHSSLE